jgi:DNA helicase IV
MVVDEAQDLSAMQLLMLKRRSARNHMTLVGDIAQSTGPHMRDSWEDVLTILKGREGGQVQPLRFGYRVPFEVHELADSILPTIAPGIDGPQAVRRSGHQPDFFECAISDLASRAIEDVMRHAGSGRSVGLVSPDGMADGLAEKLVEKGINFADARNGSLGASINLVPSSLAKGLEFDAVVLVDPLGMSEKGSQEGLRNLYIALTRTTNFLSIVHAGLPDVLQRFVRSNGTQGESPDAGRQLQEQGNERDLSEVQERFIGVLAEQIVVMLENLKPKSRRDVLDEVQRQLDQKSS